MTYTPRSYSPAIADPQVGPRRLGLGPGQGLYRLPFRLGQPGGDRHLHRHEKVADALAGGYAVTPDPEGATRAGAGGNLEPNRPLERGHGDLRAEGGFGEGDRHRQGEVSSPAAEQRMGRHHDGHVQVARRPPGAAGPAAAIKTD